MDRRVAAGPGMHSLGRFENHGSRGNKRQEVLDSRSNRPWADDTHQQPLALDSRTASLVEHEPEGPGHVEKSPLGRRPCPLKLREKFGGTFWLALGPCCPYEASQSSSNLRLMALGIPDDLS